MNAEFLSSCNFADVRWVDGDLPGLGEAPCTAYHPGLVNCNQYTVTLDTQAVFANPYASDQHTTNKVACHENGHKSPAFPNAPAGQHDCMISGYVNGASVWTIYGNHHKGHINNDAF